jgi:predicted dehydrogenase
MRYLAGDIAEVFAHYDRRVMKGEDFTIPDIQSVSFRFASGALGYSSSSCLMTRGGGQSTMEVLLEGLRLSRARRTGEAHAQHRRTFHRSSPKERSVAHPFELSGWTHDRRRDAGCKRVGAYGASRRPVLCHVPLTRASLARPACLPL